jgi:glycine dehydrogenase subunit 2
MPNLATKKIENTENNMKDSDLDAIIGGTRGLRYEESLLLEQSNEGACAVDLPSVANFKNNTGEKERPSIGLPQVSEPDVVRHFVRLSTLNYSIDSGIFPLGSCTMKHNPRINEKNARMDGFANIHPLQPESTIQGALALTWELQNWLAEVSGLHSVTLNPAAGAHGEYAGVMTIRRAHEKLGRTHKKVMLIPDSAHGTNPATAAACGFEIVTLPTGKDGLVDFEVFKTKLNDNVAGMMLTNPNTCGLYESNAHLLADALHKVGGYFYCDGANFNAIVGKVKPAHFGVDVMHFNLHKTFSTPHGGGGPGCGPIAVCEELAPYLPVPIVRKDGEKFYYEYDNENTFGRMKGFQGQFGMFVRALSYMLSHGGDGLRQVAEDAVLNANYIKSQVQDLYNICFPEHHCMHEFLMNDKFQKEHGVTTMDIAKTMVEYGIHPMTVYFPLVVQAAMLVEPTETESKAQLDRLIAVLRRIALDAKAGKGDALHANPVSTPRRRSDEVKAAKELKLTF